MGNDSVSVVLAIVFTVEATVKYVYGDGDDIPDIINSVTFSDFSWWSSRC